MVCSRCQKLQKKTELATPSVKRKSDIYYGSSTTGDKTKSSATAGPTGIGKVLRLLSTSTGTAADVVHQSKLLSKSAKNPYAAYSSSCTSCKTKIDQGYKFCHKCAYKAGNGMYHNTSIQIRVARLIVRIACAMCGKTQHKEASTNGGSTVQGQRFSAK